MVKEFENDPTADVWVVLDLYSPPSDGRSVGARFASDDPLAWLSDELEYRIMLAASLVRRSLALGRSVGLIMNAEQPVVLPPERSDRQYVRILELLAVVTARDEPSLVELVTSLSGRFRRDSVLLAVTSHADPNLVGVLATMRRRRISSEVHFVDSNMSPDPQSAAFLEDLHREHVPGYRLTRADHPTSALHIAASLAGAGVR
jgi:uncharacterized protein (DUF58 family)